MTTFSELITSIISSLHQEGFIKDADELQHLSHLALDQTLLSKVAALGYDATEKDLLAEKKMLTTMLSKQLECSPSSTSLGAEVFDFPWGGVISRADLKSTWCGIEVRYK